MGAPHCSRWPVGVIALAIGCLGAGAGGAAPAAAGGAASGAAHSGMTLHAEAGYGQATYAFHGDGAPTLTRHLLDLEVGLARPIAAGGALRLGCSLSLMPAADRARQDDSYALITFDMLTLEYGGPGFLRARVGLGLVRVCAPVNEMAIGLSATVGRDVGPVYVGLKGRASRFEVDFEPHGTPPDTKYKLYYAGVVLGLATGGD